MCAHGDKRRCSRDGFDPVCMLTLKLCPMQLLLFLLPLEKPIKWEKMDAKIVDSKGRRENSKYFTCQQNKRFVSHVSSGAWWQVVGVLVWDIVFCKLIHRVPPLLTWWGLLSCLVVDPIFINNEGSWFVDLF